MIKIYINNFVSFVVLCILTTLVQAATPYAITVKSGPLRQSFKGFGASQARSWAEWDSEPREEMTDLVYGDLGINVLRLWVSTGDTITVADMLDQFDEFFISSGAIADVTARGVDTLLLAPAAGGGAPPPASISDYAENLAELILQIKTTFGVEIDVTGISNEPGTWSKQQVVDCVNFLRAELDSRGLATVEIIAPEISSPDGTVSYVDAMYEDGAAWANIKAFSSHSYGSVLNDDKLYVRKQGKEWWMTEASDDGNEFPEDENRAASIAARFLCELNYGVDVWVFFIGLGQKADATIPAGTTAFLTLYDKKTDTIFTYLKYFYFKQILETTEVGAIFRECLSDSEGSMFQVAFQNPAINAAAAYNPDGSWGINIVNDTGITGSPATTNNYFYPAESFDVTITVEELQNTPSMEFAVYRSSANNHIVSSGTLTFNYGVAQVTVSDRELVSLRSAPTVDTIPPAPVALNASTIVAPVSLTWHNTVKATSWNVKRAEVTGGPYSTIGTTTDTIYHDMTAEAGTTYFYVVSAVNGVGESFDSNEVFASPTPALPWTDMDIGNVGVPGYVEVDQDGRYDVYGSGTLIGSDGSDSYNYCYQPLHDDGSIIAYYNSPWATNKKIGIMMSDDLGNSPKMVFNFFDSNGSNFNTVRMLTRIMEDNYGSWNNSAVGGDPLWLKLTRQGNDFTGYASHDGANWTTIATRTVVMGENYYGGMVVCGYSQSALTQGRFESVQSPPIAPLELTAQLNPGSIRVGWTASYGADWYNVYRSVSGGSFQLVDTIYSNEQPAHVDNAPVDNATYAVEAVNAMGTSDLSAEYDGWQNADIGSPLTSGESEIDAAGVFYTAGSGVNLGGYPDSYNLTYRKMSGDGTIVARLLTSDAQLWGNSKVGITMCEDLSPGPRAATVMYDANSNFDCARMAARTVNGTWSSSWKNAPAMDFPLWLKITRSGDEFTGYVSSDGSNWTMIDSRTIAMPSEIYVGLANCSRNPNNLSYADFDQVSVAE